MTFPRSIKNAGTLMTGNVVGQGIAFLSYLLLSRLFTPEDFGLFNIFSGYLEVLIILSTCKYEQAIVVAHNDGRAVQVSRMTLRLNLIVSLAVLAAVGVVTAAAPTTLPIPLPMVWLIPLFVFINGTSRVYSALNVRTEQFRAIAGADVTGSLTGTLAKLATGLLAPALRWLHTYGLPLGTVLGLLARNTCLRRRSATFLKKFPKKSSPKALLATARHYKHYPLYVMPKEFLSSLSANLPFLWLALYFDNATIGLFSLALTFLQRPILMVANAMESSFYSDSANRQREGKPLFGRLWRMTAGLAAVSVPIALAGFFWAEPIFTFLLGDQWVGTGFYVRCLLPWLVVRLLANSLAFVGNLFETQYVDFWMQVALLVLRVAALAIGIALNNFRLAIFLFAAVSTLVQSVQLLWYLFQVRRYDSK